MSKSSVKIDNPLPGGQGYTTIQRATEYCNRGIAYFLKDGRLRFRAANQSRREASDVHVDTRGTIFWNGARSHYVNGMDIAMYPPCCNVVYPKGGTRRAAERYA